jgi:hypothetical protein
MTSEHDISLIQTENIDMGLAEHIVPEVEGFIETSPGNLF